MEISLFFMRLSQNDHFCQFFHSTPIYLIDQAQQLQLLFTQYLRSRLIVNNRTIYTQYFSLLTYGEYGVIGFDPFASIIHGTPHIFFLKNRFRLLIDQFAHIVQQPLRYALLFAVWFFH